LANQSEVKNPGVLPKVQIPCLVCIPDVEMLW